MAYRTQITWQCDICQYDDARTNGVDELPKGWLKLMLGHPVLEREFITRYVCYNCAETIVHEHSDLKVVAALARGKLPAVHLLSALNTFIMRTWKVTPNSKQLKQLEGLLKENT